MSRIDDNKASRQHRLRKVLAGMSKHFQSIPSLTFAQVVHGVADLEARIQKDIDATDTTGNLKAAWLAAVQMERNSHQDIDPLLRAIKQSVLLLWGDTGESAAVLEDFGYAPRKPLTVSPEVRVAAAAKAKATRAARHTMGPRARLEIKGVLAPAAPLAAEAASPAPAIPGPAATTGPPR